MSRKPQKSLNENPYAAMGTMQLEAWLSATHQSLRALQSLQHESINNAASAIAAWSLFNRQLMACKSLEELAQLQTRTYEQLTARCCDQANAYYHHLNKTMES